MMRLAGLIFLIVSMITLQPGVSYAGMMTVGQLTSPSPESQMVDSVKERALQGLENPEISQEVEVRLQQLGISKDEARQRIAALSNPEIQQMLQGQTMQAGGDILVTVLIVVLIIFLIQRI